MSGGLQKSELWLWMFGGRGIQANLGCQNEQHHTTMQTWWERGADALTSARKKTHFLQKRWGGRGFTEDSYTLPTYYFALQRSWKRTQRGEDRGVKRETDGRSRTATLALLKGLNLREKRWSRINYKVTSGAGDTGGQMAHSALWRALHIDGEQIGHSCRSCHLVLFWDWNLFLSRFEARLVTLREGREGWGGGWDWGLSKNHLFRHRGETYLFTAFWASMRFPARKVTPPTIARYLRVWNMFRWVQ